MAIAHITAPDASTPGQIGDNTGIPVVRLNMPGVVERRVVSYQDATYICQIDDDDTGNNGMLENLADTATNSAEVAASIVSLTGFAANKKQAVVQAHFNNTIVGTEGWIILVAVNLQDATAAFDAFTALIAIGDDTAVGGADRNLGRVGTQNALYDILSVSNPVLHYDLRGTTSEISRIDLLACDSAGAVANSDLVVTSRVW